MRVVHHLARTLAHIKCGEVEVTCNMCGLQLLSTIYNTRRCFNVVVCWCVGLMVGIGERVFVCGM